MFKRERWQSDIKKDDEPNGLYAQAVAAGLLKDHSVPPPDESERTSLYRESLISIDQIKSPEEIYALFEMADVMEAIVESKGEYRPLKGFVVAELFWESSTRTSVSFEAAAKRLGATVIVRDGMKVFSSVTKGESLEDTVHAAFQVSNCDLIVLRHHRDNSAERAVSIASHYNIPVVNAGSGSREHPTQALLDLYTIRRMLGRTEELNVLMIGDMKNGRTNKSLAKLLALMDPNVKITFVAPNSLRLPEDFANELSERGVNFEEREDYLSVLPDADVVYMTRVQQERFTSPEAYEAVKGKYIFKPEHAHMMKESSILMHPLPRVDEIEYEVDQDPHAAYFDQMRSGLYVRMAILHEILLGHRILE